MTGIIIIIFLINIFFLGLFGDFWYFVQWIINSCNLRLHSCVCGRLALAEAELARSICVLSILSTNVVNSSYIIYFSNSTPGSSYGIPGWETDSSLTNNSWSSSSSLSQSNCSLVGFKNWSLLQYYACFDSVPLWSIFLINLSGTGNS